MDPTSGGHFKRESDVRGICPVGIRPYDRFGVSPTSGAFRRESGSGKESDPECDSVSHVRPHSSSAEDPTAGGHVRRESDVREIFRAGILHRDAFR